MDRFIVSKAVTLSLIVTDLKSSMDRFIDNEMCDRINLEHYLKSSMDRFIDVCRFCCTLTQGI